ncbi:hypothetical protein FRB99_006963 [Tulasnella sp. 403]|nr:hypothetical protein FRB99_006963 [Tulasnella sp. 403]
MSEKPSVLILGGLPNATRHLAGFLVPEGGEPLVSYLRIVDKYSVFPPTTYTGSAFLNVLQSPITQYQQGNLLIPANVTKVFDPPEGVAPFSYVFDCTGDTTFDRPNEIQRDHTAKLAYSLGQEAARRNVKAYVRVTGPYYDFPNDKKADEKENPKPKGVRGVWWHAALRMLAGIENLNLVILRTATVYGPFNLSGIVTPRITLGRVYKYLDEEMKYLWTPDIRMHTVHLDDVAGAMWAAANWMGPLGRAEANKIAGETIQFWAPEKKELIKDLEGHPPKDQGPIAPLFNIVDDSDSTQGSMGQAVADIFGIKFGFFGMLANAKLRIDFDNMVEEINSKHVEAWTEICLKSEPKIINPTVQAYIDAHLLAKYSISLSNEKLKGVMGYTLKRPGLNVQLLREIIQSFRVDGHWPTYQDEIA